MLPDEGDIRDCLGDQVQCPGCSMPYQTDTKLPKILPCRHTICSCCVSRLAECPDCGTALGPKENLGDGSTTNLPVWLAVDGLSQFGRDCSSDYDTLEDIQEF
eukprot:1671809-Rhodomonas_salina.1